MSRDALTFHVLAYDCVSCAVVISNLGQNGQKKMRTLSIKIIFFTNYRKYAVTRNYKNPVFYSVREKQVSAFSGSREEEAGRRKQGGGSREVP